MDLVFGPDPECICKRPNALVKCTKCGFKLYPARVFKICEAHPSDIYLSDLKACHKCKGELAELPLEAGYDPNICDNTPTGRSPIDTQRVGIQRPRSLKDLGHLANGSFF